MTLKHRIWLKLKNLPSCTVMILTNKIYKPVIRMQFIAMQLVWVKFKRTHWLIRFCNVPLKLFYRLGNSSQEARQAGNIHEARQVIMACDVSYLCQFFPIQYLSLLVYFEHVNRKNRKTGSICIESLQFRMLVLDLPTILMNYIWLKETLTWDGKWLPC